MDYPKFIVSNERKNPLVCNGLRVRDAKDLIMWKLLLEALKILLTLPINALKVLTFLLSFTTNADCW